MAREITQSDFAVAHAEGAVVVDVRERFEYLAGHVPGAALVPLGQLTAAVDDLPVDRRIHVICATGNRSLAAADFLVARGRDAVSVAGGTLAWQRAGRPVVTGTAAA